jgi:surface protein
VEEIIGLENWRPESCTTFGSMFYGCGKLTTANMSGWTVPNLESMSHMFADCHNLKNVYFTGWQTPKLNNMDGLFNHCMALETVDMSMFNTSNVTVFAQVFEICSSLKEIKGLENWNTAKGNDFSEMFSGCSSLTELNLSSFDTTNAYSSANTYPGIANWCFLRFMSGCSSLEKITFGANFDFDGQGCPDGYKFYMSSSTNVEGWDGHWYNATTGEALTPSQIPEKTAATYVAVKP